MRSDGAVGSVETLRFNPSGIRTVSKEWALRCPNLTTYDGWQVMKIPSPNVMASERALFSRFLNEAGKVTGENGATLGPGRPKDGSSRTSIGSRNKA
jgi:hypothetical protein